MHEEHYEVLEVDEDATLEELRSAYEQAVKEVHPDRNDSPQATEQFKQVQEAYDTLRRVHATRDSDDGPSSPSPSRSPDRSSPASASGTDPASREHWTTGRPGGATTPTGEAGEDTAGEHPSSGATTRETGTDTTAAGTGTTQDHRASDATSSTAPTGDGHRGSHAHRGLLESVLVALIAPFAVVAILFTNSLFSRRAAVVGIPTAVGYLVAAYQVVFGTASPVTYLLGVAVLAVMLARVHVGVFTSVTVIAVVGAALVAGVGITAYQAALVLALIPPVLLGAALASAY